MTYSQKLKDPRWQKKRLEILQRDNFTCQKCKAIDKTLNVHHRWYEKNNEVWDYPDIAYQTLCEDCHKNTNPEIKNFLLRSILTNLSKLSSNELEIFAVRVYLEYVQPIEKHRGNHG